MCACGLPRSWARQLHPGPFCQNSGSPTAQMFALLVQGGRRNQGWVTILAPNAGVIVPKGALLSTPLCRMSSPSLSLPSLSHRGICLGSVSFCFFLPFGPLFLEECVKGLDASDFRRWRDLLGPLCPPQSLKLEFPLAVSILTFEKTLVPRKPQKRVHL